MKLIIGLGNPGSKYDLTRHNIGKRLMIHFAEKLGLKLEQKSSLKSSLAIARGEIPFALIYPHTYMNLSGEAVRKIFDYYKLEDVRDVLLVVDEAALPFGHLRLRGSGSAGGHNGLKSVENYLKSQDYSRLRLGVGRHSEKSESIADYLGPMALEDFVLSKFLKEEEEQMLSVLDKGVEACQAWLKEPIEQAMHQVN